MSTIKRCKRCARRLRGRGDGWNVAFRDGRPLHLVCPTCQTSAENAEAEINAATLTYGQLADGTTVAWPKAGGDDR